MKFHGDMIREDADKKVCIESLRKELHEIIHEMLIISKRDGNG